MDSRDIYYSTVCTSAAEFALAEQYHSFPEVFPFEKLIKIVFQVRLETLNVPQKERKQIIKDGIEAGIKLLPQIIEAGFIVFRS